MIVWEELLRTTVPGEPTPKGRPRFARTSTGVRTYSSTKTVAFERAVALCVQTARRRWPIRGPIAPKGTPVRVDIVAVFSRPQRLLRKKDPAGLLPKSSRRGGDLDNVCKAAIDGVSQAGTVWEDDGQCQCIRAESWYAEKGERPRTEIIIYTPTGSLDEVLAAVPG